jgi:hypothetical protein
MKKRLLVLLSMLCTSVALAEPPADAKLEQAASALVNKQIVQKLKAAEAKRSKFSRAGAPPKARRVRVLDTVAQTDARGKQFVRFAIDAHYRGADDDEWEEDVFVGCAYVDQKTVFVKLDEDYLPASSALIGGGEPQADVCRPAPEKPLNAEPEARPS